MTQSRLDELMNKSKENTIDLNEIAEICGETLKSLSRHSNDIKLKLTEIEKKLAQIESELNNIKSSHSAFGVIDDMDEF